MEVASTGDGIQLTDRSVPVRLLVVLTTLGVVLGALGWAYALMSGPRDEFRSERQDIVTRASDFAVTFNTYKVSDKADYQRRVKKLMTRKYFDEYKKITDAMFTVLQDKKQSSGDVKVLSVAVDSVDKDSAVAIAAINSSVSVAGQKAAVLRRFRWNISLVKASNGEWLVNRFDTVPVMNASTDKKGSTQ